MNDPTKPAWWNKARELEHADQLEAAERLLRDAIPHQAFALEIAEMYRDRMKRLAAAGDPSRAADALKKARSWANFYASQATSGGEGAALSLDRDEFLATLPPDPSLG